MAEAEDKMGLKMAHVIRDHLAKHSADIIY